MANVAIANFPLPPSTIHHPLPLPFFFFLHQPTHTVIEKLASPNIRQKKRRKKITSVGVKMSALERPNVAHSKRQLCERLSINLNGRVQRRYNWLCVGAAVRHT